MERFRDDFLDYEEQPDETDIENPEFDLEIPDVYWEKDIAQIENPILRKREIELAKELQEKEMELNLRTESGEISSFQAETELNDLRAQMSQAATRAGLASVGLTHDHLVDVAEKYDWLTTGDDRILNLTDKVERTIELLGPERAKKLADEMMEEGKIGKKAYDYILRQVRISSLK